MINPLRIKWIFSNRQGLIYTSSYWFACHQNIFMPVTKYIFTLPSCTSSAANDVYIRPHKVTCYNFLVVRCIFLWLLSYFWVTFSKNSLVVGLFLRSCWSWRFWVYIYVLGCSETIPTATFETTTGRVCTSLVVWMHVQWLSAGYSEDVHIRPWREKIQFS